MKIKIDEKLLSSLKQEAHQVYTKDSIERFNREDFLAYAYLVAVIAILNQRGTNIKIEYKPTDLTSTQED